MRFQLIGTPRMSFYVRSEDSHGESRRGIRHTMNKSQLLGKMASQKENGNFCKNSGDSLDL
jgi:hypothetical protein